MRYDAVYKSVHGCKGSVLEDKLRIAVAELLNDIRKVLRYSLLEQGRL